MSFKVGRFEVNLLGIIATIVVAVGILGPWLWRGYDSWSEFNPMTREIEMHYHTIYVLTPLSISVIKDGILESIAWFPSPECSVSGATLLSAAALHIFKFRRKWPGLAATTLCYAASAFFFLSLGGRGLGLGSTTFLGWGFKTALIGVILSTISSLIGILTADK